MAPSRLLGVGEADATQTFVSASYLQVYGPDQIVAYLKPYITNIPINLWGRDFLKKMKATICLKYLTNEIGNVDFFFHNLKFFLICKQ